MPNNLSTQARAAKTKHPLESLELGVDFTLLLGPGELLTGSPVVTGGQDLVLGTAAVNVATFLDDAEDGGMTVAIGCGVQFRASGGTPLTNYSLVASCATTLGNTRAVVCVLCVRAN